jgi:hypothetical protein
MSVYPPVCTLRVSATPGSDPPTSSVLLSLLHMRLVSLSIYACVNSQAQVTPLGQHCAARLQALCFQQTRRPASVMTGKGWSRKHFQSLWPSPECAHPQVASDVTLFTCSPSVKVRYEQVAGPSALTAAPRHETSAASQASLLCSPVPQLSTRSPCSMAQHCVLVDRHSLGMCIEAG